MLVGSGSARSSYAPVRSFPAASLHHGKLGSVTARTHTVIGVDVGGTKVAGMLLRGRVPGAASPAPDEQETFEVLRRFTTSTENHSPEACLDAIESCIRNVAGRERVEGLGVGVASMVEFGAGRAVASVNLPLTDVPLRDILQERLGIPTAIDNDATVAGIGEHEFGAGVGTRDMIMLTLGTGVGGGIILGGRPYRGASGAAAELGHIIVDVDGPPCPADCPNHGCLEAYVSGTAMGAAALAEAQASPASALGRALAAGEAVDSLLLTRLALDGDPGALALVTMTGEYLGAGLVTLVNAFNPQLIVIGGGAAAAGELLLAPARRVLMARALSPARDEVRVVPARLGTDAGMVGAAALALIELFPEAAPDPS